MSDSQTSQETVPKAAIEKNGDPVAFSPGPYHGWRDGEQPFAIEVDARPLQVLFEDARNGVRLYEFMSIDRPGDIYCYLRVRTVDVSKPVNERTQYLKARWVRSRQIREWGEGYFPFNRFDGLFHWDGDDTTPEAECWLRFRAGRYWEDTAIRLLAWVKEQQQRLRDGGDWLTLRELGYMSQRRHRRDFISEFERRCLSEPQQISRGTLPGSVLAVIKDLIARETVQSVSAPFSDFQLWRILCEEQLRRADQTGYEPEEAFTLSGPDGGLWHVPYQDWGADVHIPYEGVCMADLYIKPDWRRDSLERDSEGGQLVRIFSSFGYDVDSGYVCHFVLTPDDLGELLCASRREVGDGWVLYQSKQPYEPNPRCKPHLKAIERGDP